jgi:endonuclease/exonuclease/phosphatase family metal-dependent hydrolase
VSKLSFFNKFVFALNIVLGVVTLSAYVLPFLAPKTFPILAVFTLFMPIVLGLNILFVIYWLLRRKSQFLLSGILLLVGLPFLNSFYKFKKVDEPNTPDEWSLLSYNVRLFNHFDWIKGVDVNQPMQTLFDDLKPDVICIQEYTPKHKIRFKDYPYQHIVMSGNKIKTGHAIFSKFPMIQKGSVRLSQHNTESIFVDLKIKQDTIRVYNIHLQSVKISPDVHEIHDNIQEVTQARSKKMLSRMSQSFQLQQKEAEALVKHRSDVLYPVVVAGDLNNSSFSYVYRKVRGTLLDAFAEAGKGFGKSYFFKHYPARIDYIFADPQLEVLRFDTFNDFEYSDHYPLFTRLRKRD